MKPRSATRPFVVALTCLACALPGCGEGEETQTSSSAPPPPAAVEPDPERPQEETAKPSQPQADAPKRKQASQAGKAETAPPRPPKPDQRQQEGEAQSDPRPAGCPSSLSAAQCNELAQQQGGRSKRSPDSESPTRCPKGVDRQACLAAQEAQEQGEAEGKRETPEECPEVLSAAQCRELEEQVSRP
jgi:hypothetical protein